MKFMDSDGRIFGKVNIIDLLVIVFLLCFLPLAFHAYNEWVNKSDVKEPLKVTVRFNNVGPELSEMIKKGDVEVDLKDNVIGKITEVISVKPPELLPISNILTPDKVNVTGTYQPLNRNVTVAMELLCKKRSRHFYYKDSIVKMGPPIIFSSDMYELSGEVIGMENK